MPEREKLAEFTAWCGKHISGDEKGQAQIFLDRLFQAFGHSGVLDAGGQSGFRVCGFAVLRQCSTPCTSRIRPFARK